MLRDIERALWIAGLVGQALILYRLYALRLLREYPLFAAWCGAAVLRALLLLPFDLNSQEYARMWLIVRPPTWILTILAVVEISNRAFRSFSGISRFVRRFNLVASGAAIVIAGATVQSTWGEPVYLYRVFLRVGQAVDISATIFLLLLMVLLQFFPMPVSRNLVRHATFFAIYMLIQALLLFYELFSIRLDTREVSVAARGISTAMFAAWIFAWSRGGERLDERAAANPEAERELVSSLTAINAALAGSSPTKPGG